MKYKISYQTANNDCGVACLSMILKYYHGFASIEYIKSLVNLKKEGTSFYDLKEACKQLRIHAECFHVDDTFLNQKIKNPFISHMKYENQYHYIVVYKIEKNHLLIVDPSKGVLEHVKKSEFKKSFTNNVIVTYPSTPLTLKAKYNLYTFYKEYIKKEKVRKLIIKSTILMFLEALTTSILFLLLEIKKLHLLNVLCIIIMIFYLVKNSILYFQNKETLTLKLKLESRLKENLWKNTLSSPLNVLTTKQVTLPVLLKQTEEISEFYIHVLIGLFIHLPLFIFFFIVQLFYLHHLSFFLCFFLTEIILFKKLQKKNKLTTFKYQNACYVNSEQEKAYHSNLENIKNACLEKSSNLKIKETIENDKNNTFLYGKELLKENIFTSIMNELFLLFALYLIASSMIQGNLKISLALFLFQIQQIMLEQIKYFTNIFLDGEKVKIMIENIEDDIEKINNQVKIESIDVSNEKVKYGNLKNVSMHLKKKDTLLLLGNSGVGKTTLMHMLMGDINSNHKLINKKSEKGRLENITYISSNPFMIKESILDNIIFKREVKKEKLNNILKMLNIDETFLKKEISSLSSGEKQRVTLARVLLQESDVLILDEALNQIEEKEEIRIIKEVMKLYQDKILIIISHRKNLIHLIPKIGIMTKEGQIKYQKGENYV